MIFMLQQQLKEAHEQIARLQQENEQLRTLRMPPDTEPGGSFEGNSNSNTPLHNWTTDPGHEAEPGCVTPGQQLMSSQSGTDAKNEASSENVTQRTTPDLPAALLALSVKNKVCAGSSYPLSIVQNQNCEDDFTSGTFAYKVTPDSGMQTQEEEDASMDAPDLSEAVSQHQACDIHVHRTHSSPLVASRTTPEKVNMVKMEICSPQVGSERTSIYQTSYTPQKSGFPNDTGGEALRTSSPSKSSCPRSLQTLIESCASDRTTEHASSPFVVYNRAEGGQWTHPEEAMDSENIEAGRTNHTLETRYEKTSPVTTIENKIDERSYGESIIDDSKTALHATLGLNSTRFEDDKGDCQFGLVNGSPVTGQGL